MNRRTVLKRGLALAASSSVVVLPSALPAASEPKEMSVDEFLAKAKPNEIVRYHSNALMEALHVQRPDLHWAVLTDIDLTYVFVVGRQKAPPKLKS